MRRKTIVKAPLPNCQLGTDIPNLTVFTVTAPDRIPEKAVSNWENSPGHLATMIDPNCDTVGVGVTIDNGRAFCYMFVGNPTAHNPYA